MHIYIHMYMHPFFLRQKIHALNDKVIQRLSSVKK